MTEWSFSVFARERPSRKQLFALAGELAEIWLAAAGHVSPAG